jgi:hypothetical protein
MLITIENNKMSNEKKQKVTFPCRFLIVVLSGGTTP